MRVDPGGVERRELTLKVLPGGAGCGVAQRAGHEPKVSRDLPPAEETTAHRVWLTAELLSSDNMLVNAAGVEQPRR